MSADLEEQPIPLAPVRRGRVKAFRINAEEVLEFLKGAVVISTPLPRDARVIEVRPWSVSDAFAPGALERSMSERFDVPKTWPALSVLIGSEEWDEIDEGKPVPYAELEVSLRRTIGKRGEV